MQEIADWLEKLGMSEYTQSFTEHRIDVSVLRDLTDQDLKDIGMPLGHRRKILAAIGELTAIAPATPKFAAGTEPGPDTAERRQVTVMFSDLVGSTTLSTRARSFLPIRNASQRRCSASMGSWRDTWGTVPSCILAIPKPMRTTPSGPYRRGSN